MAFGFLMEDGDVDTLAVQKAWVCGSRLVTPKKGPRPRLGADLAELLCILRFFCLMKKMIPCAWKLFCCTFFFLFAVETACNLTSWYVSKVFTSLRPSSPLGFPSFDLSTILPFCIFRLLNLPVSFWTFRVTDPSFPLPLYSVCFQGLILGVPHQFIARSASF